MLCRQVLMNGLVMLTICDTHILLFWADNKVRLSKKAYNAIENAIAFNELACSDISLWEIAMLYSRGRINNQVGISSSNYIQDILTAYNVKVLPITPSIAEISQSEQFIHGDPADRIIGATALVHRLNLITADEKLHAVSELNCIW